VTWANCNSNCNWTRREHQIVTLGSALRRGKCRERTRAGSRMRVIRSGKPASGISMHHSAKRVHSDEY
jgi:hypothetical protein